MRLLLAVIVIAVLLGMSGCGTHPARAEVAASQSSGGGGKLLLVTEHFEVTIIHNCPEGCVSCNEIIYCGVSKKSGRSVRLKGSTLHTHGPDGTPARFLGYEFKNGSVTYLVLEEGRLTVVQGKSTVLVDEPGKWQ